MAGTSGEGNIRTEVVKLLKLFKPQRTAEYPANFDELFSTVVAAFSVIEARDEVKKFMIAEGGRLISYFKVDFGPTKYMLHVFRLVLSQMFYLQELLVRSIVFPTTKVLWKKNNI